jgi:hypothetical protein
MSGDLPYNHSTCRAFFDVIWIDKHWRPMGIYDYWPNGWAKWRQSKKTYKRYQGICYEPNQKRRHYEILWTEESGLGTFSLPVPHQETTVVSGDVNATATTTWWENAPVHYVTRDVYVWVWISTEVTPALAANRDPALFESGATRGKRGLEDAFKFIAKDSSSPDQRKP